MSSPTYDKKSTSRLRLDAAIATLYEVFSKYVVIGPVYCPCDHCVSVPEEARSVSGDLQSLSSGALAGFAFDAINEWGTVDEFKGFLPRIFELVALDPRFGIEPIVLSKLVLGQWRDWRPSEQVAVEKYLGALVSFAVQDGRDYLNLPGIADGAVECGFDVRAALQAALDDDHSIETTAALCKLVSVLPDKLTDPAESDDLGQGNNAYLNIRNWLRTDEVKQRFEKAFIASQEDPELASQISQAIDVIDWLCGDYSEPS